MIEKYGFYLVWLIASLATLGSFYLEASCCLDWYQRICLFPLVFTAGMAAWRGELMVASYLIPQTVIGFLLAISQILLMKKVNWIFNLCSISQEPSFVPYVSAAIFLFMTILLVAISRQFTKRIPL